MEPITLAGLFVVAVGGGMYFNAADQQLHEDTEPQAENVSEVASKSTSFTRGVFIPTDSGYYISNLSSEPVKVEGCDQPVLVADLSQPRSTEVREVSTVMVDCEG